MSSRSVLVLGCCVAATATAADAWQPLRELLDGWEFTDNYAISVGDASGQLFQYIGKGGNVSMKTVLPTGSTSKWPSAMMFAGLVADGTIASLDSKVSDYVSWWTKNASDPRSMVTLKMLLSFTSGFGGGAPGDEGNSRAARRWRAANGRSAPTPTSAKAGLAAVAGEAAASACDEEKGDTTECGQSIYEHVKLIGTPGQVYSYNSNHLQIAAAMAVAASGLPIHEVTKKYLLTPYGMTDSYYDGKCPDFGVDLMTTGEDYEKFLSGVLTYKPLPRAIVDASEQDYTKFLGTNYTMYGDYGFGHFLMCFDSVSGYTATCASAQSHMDPGAFGWIPIIDRKHGFYLQVVAAEISPTGSYPLSGIPEYLAVAIKTHVEAILGPNPPSTAAHESHDPALLSLSVADVNYCLGCKLHPLTCL